MTFGVQAIAYTDLYIHDYETYANEHGLQQSGDANDRIFAAKTALKTKIVEQGRSYEVNWRYQR